MFSKSNSFDVITDLLNRGNLKVAIAQLCPRATSLQSYYVITYTEVGEQNILTKYSKYNSFQVRTDSFQVTLKVDVAQICNEL